MLVMMISSPNQAIDNVRKKTENSPAFHMRLLSGEDGQPMEQNTVAPRGGPLAEK